MSKILSCAAALLLLAGCASKQLRQSPEDAINEQNHTTATTKMEVLNFKTENGKKLSLASNDLFDTAVLTDSEGKTHNLTRQRSASGIYMENDKGVSIHFKEGGEGIVEFSKYNSLSISQVD